MYIEDAPHYAYSCIVSPYGERVVVSACWLAAKKSVAAKKCRGVLLQCGEKIIFIGIWRLTVQEVLTHIGVVVAIEISLRVAGVVPEWSGPST